MYPTIYMYIDLQIIEKDNILHMNNDFDTLLYTYVRISLGFALVIGVARISPRASSIITALEVVNMLIYEYHCEYRQYIKIWLWRWLGYHRRWKNITSWTDKEDQNGIH